MGQLQGKNILVVGASGGLGREFCAQLGQAGANVFGTASSNESSARLPADLAQRLLLDLDSDVSIQALTDYLIAAPVSLDGVVLAAGLVAFGGIGDTPALVIERLMRVNATGQMQLVARLLPKLSASAAVGNEPFVLSISGVVAENPLSGLAAYSASKTALHGFALAASKELRKAGIQWVDARPGHTESGLAGRAIFGVAPNFGVGMPVAQVVARMIAGLESLEKDLPSSAF
jgi:cyclic-di-GMP-binding biofilm dispersal mediator protein